MSVTASCPSQSEKKEAFDNFPNLKKMLPPNYDYYFETYEECEPFDGEDRFTASFRIGQDTATKDNIKEWINAFCSHSLTTYRIDRTYPGETKWYVYRVDLRCHRNTKPKSHKRVKTPHKKHTDCPAKMILKIRQPTLSRRKRHATHLKNYPVEVILWHRHNHSVSKKCSLKYRDPNAGVVEKFVKMYNAGYKPSAALKIHKRDLLLEYEDNFASVVEDRGLCPDVNWCYRQFDSLSKSGFEINTSNLQVQTLQQVISKYNKKCGIKCAAVKSCEEASGNIVVVLLSPLMRSVHAQLNCSANFMLIESQAVDYLRCKVYMLTTHNGAFKLPLGVLITTSDSAYDLQRALSLYLELIPDSGFGGRSQEGPCLILLEDDDMQESVVKEVFPKSAVLLSPRFVVQKVWASSCEMEGESIHSCRLDLIDLLKKAMCAESVSNFESYFEKLVLIVKLSSNSKLSNYVEDLYSKKHKWAPCFMDNKEFPFDNIEMIKGCLSSIEDQFFSTNKSCTMAELIEFLLDDMEQFYKQKLCKFVEGNYNDMLCLLLNKNSNTLDVLEIVPYFKVKNVSNGNYYDVDMKSGLCSCFLGKIGRPCQHRNTVIQNVNFEVNIQRQYISSPKNELKGLYERLRNLPEIVSDPVKDVYAKCPSLMPKRDDSTCVQKSFENDIGEQNICAFEDIERMKINSQEARISSNSGSKGISSQLKTLPNEDVKCRKNMNSDELVNSKLIHDYPCHICGKVMLTYMQLRKHQKLHSHNKPFACDICGLGYLSNDCLKNHYSRNHGIKKKFQCEVCGKTFQRLSTLAQHRDKHKSRHYECSLCEKIFFLDEELRKHVNEVHKGEPSSIVLEEVSQASSPLHIPRQEVTEIIITESGDQWPCPTEGIG